MVSTERTITLHGNGHWSTKGDLEGKIEYWSFGLLISGKPNPTPLGYRSAETKAFYAEIKNQLPEGYKDRLTPPEHIPDAVGWSLQIPLTDFKEPNVTLRIFRKYFPDLME